MKACAVAFVLLAHSAAAQVIDFLNRVLHHGTDQDRMSAALGLGKIGGDVAVRALVDGEAQQPELVRWVITNALGNTKSALAVPELLPQVR